MAASHELKWSRIQLEISVNDRDVELVVFVFFDIQPEVQRELAVSFGSYLEWAEKTCPNHQVVPLQLAETRNLEICHGKGGSSLWSWPPVLEFHSCARIQLIKYIIHKYGLPHAREYL